VNESVLVSYCGDWLGATVIWRYLEQGRPRALVRFETPTGLVVRQLRWADELRPTGRVLVVELLELDDGLLPGSGPTA
jgi:hypothetical protein